MAIIPSFLVYNAFIIFLIIKIVSAHHKIGFPGGSDSKEYACNARDPGSIPGLGRSPEEENGYPIQSSCLENSRDREAWRAIVHGVATYTIGSFLGCCH